MPIGTPAGILNVLVIANTGQANAALTKTRAAFRLTGVSANESAAASSAAWSKAGAATALAAGAVAAASSKMAIDFDKSMRNVNSIAQLPEKQFQNLSKEILKLAGPTAQAPVTIANGMYDLVSSGFDAAESLVIVKEAARGATAGLTDTAVSTKAVAAVLNAYRRPAEDAKDVTDTLFRTVDKGVITFEDLAQNIGDTLPFAASLGVTLSQVGGATATLTKQGLSASETMTRIRNVIQTMIKPGEDLKATFNKLNTTGEDLVRKKGLQGALKTLAGTTDGTKEAMAALFPNIRALGGALALTGDNTQAATQDLKALQHHSGATARALEQQYKSVAVQWNQFKAEVSTLAIEFGTKLLPVIIDAIHVFGDIGGAVFDVAEALVGMDGELRLVVLSMGAAVLATKGLMVLSGPVIALATNVAFLGGMFSTAAVQGTVLATVGTLLRTAFMNHPLMMVAAGAGLAVGAVVGLAQAFGGLFSEEKKLPPIQQRLNETSDRLKESLARQKEALGALAGSSQRVRKQHDRTKDASRAVEKAEDHYQKTLEKYPKNSRQAAIALGELTAAKVKERKATKAAERAEREHGVIRKATKPILRETLASERDRTLALKDERKALMETLRAENKYGSDTADTLQSLKKNRNELTDALKAENNTLKEATSKIGPRFAQQIEKMSNTQLQFGRRSTNVAGILKNPYKNSLLDLEGPIAKIRTQTGKLGKGFQNSSAVGLTAIDELNTGTQNAANALGINVPAFGTKGGKKQRKQKGGRLVSGVGSGDKVHLAAEPGEVVWNREAVKAMGGARAANQPNLDFKRFQGGGVVGGGLNFALGPYDVPPIQYAADHAGSNSHVHITGTTTPWIVAIGKKLQQMGFGVGEHPAFGGVAPPPTHSLTGGHYDALAIDVNSSARLDETRAEVASIARLLGGAAVGAIGGTIRELQRVLITGPDGPLKDMPQTVADKIHKGANKLLASKAGMEGLEPGVGLTSSGSGADLMKKISQKRGWSFPDWWALDAAETDHGANLTNPTSTARLRGQFLDMNWGKYGPGSDPAQNPSMDEQIISMGNYIAERYNNPTAAWAFHQAEGYYRKGGVIQKLQDGGEVEKQAPGAGFVKNFVSAFKGMEGAGDRRKLVGDTLDTIRNRSAFGVNVLNKDGSLSGRLIELRTMADMFQEYASNAFSLNEEAPWELSKDLNASLPFMVKDGDKLIQAFKGPKEAQSLLAQLQEGALGKFYDRTEGGWLGGIDKDPGKIQTLLKLRNRLIEATARIKNVKEVIQSMIDNVETQVKAVREAINRGAKLKDDLEKERNDLQKKLQGATDDHEKSRELIKKRIDKEMQKPKKKRDEVLIENLRKQLQGKSSEKEAIKEELARNHKRMQVLLETQADRGALMTALKDKVKPAFNDRFDTLVAGTTSVGSELGTVQGAVPQFDILEGIPDLGLLGGDIFDTQMRLKELKFTPGDFTDDSGESDSPGGIGIDELLKFSEAVRLGAFGSATNIPVFGAGGMSPGGWSLVGDRGPELMNLPGGTQILNNRQSQTMMPGTFILEVSLGGKRIEEMIDVKLRDEDGKELGRWRQGRVPA